MTFNELIDIPRVFNALVNSMKGLKAALIYEAAFRLELILAIFIIPSGLYLGHTPAERALLVGSWLLVLVVEMLNSAMETAVDRIGPEWHELAGRAKDMGSAAVFLSLVNVAVIWALIIF